MVRQAAEKFDTDSATNKEFLAVFYGNEIRGPLPVLRPCAGQND
jgi:hypothetical protein